MPKTYDDITRATVPEPDSGFRPTREQIEASKRGFRALDADEEALTERARTAVASVAPSVTVEVTRNRIALRGTVPDADTLRRVTDAVRDLGAEVDDEVVIAAH